VPTDGSEGANAAAQHAVDIVSRYDATLHALYVVDVRMSPNQHGDGPWRGHPVDRSIWREADNSGTGLSWGEGCSRDRGDSARRSTREPSWIHRRKRYRSRGDGNAWPDWPRAHTPRQYDGTDRPYRWCASFDGPSRYELRAETEGIGIQPFGEYILLSIRELGDPLWVLGGAAGRATVREACSATPGGIRGMNYSGFLRLFTNAWMSWSRIDQPR